MIPLRTRSALGSLPPPLPVRRGCDARLRPPRATRTEEPCDVTRLLHDADYRRFPDMDGTASRPPADDHGRARAHDARRHRPRHRVATPTSSGVLTPAAPMEQTLLHAVRRALRLLSSPVAVVATLGRPRPHAEVRDEELKDKSFAAAVIARTSTRRRGARPRLRRPRHVRHRRDQEHATGCDSTARRPRPLGERQQRRASARPRARTGTAVVGVDVVDASRRGSRRSFGAAARSVACRPCTRRSGARCSPRAPR